MEPTGLTFETAYLLENSREALRSPASSSSAFTFTGLPEYLCTRSEWLDAGPKHYMAAHSVPVYSGLCQHCNPGGPGSDPNPGTPMYICRARVQGSLVPGKWVQGNCNVAFGGSEQIMRSYEVAYGSARWVSYRGSPYGLAQTGSEADGSPLYSCRVHYYAGGTDYGYQPGKLVSDGTCHIPMGGGEVAQNPPFEVLYATGGGRPPIPYPYPYPIRSSQCSRRNHIHRAGSAIQR